MVTALVAVVLMTAGTGAAAASCAGPLSSPEQIVTGTARPIGGKEPYLPAGGYALIGRVTAVNELPGPTTSLAPTATRVDVLGAATEVHVTALAYFIGPDRGRDLRFAVRGVGRYGYPFEPGRTYFIPVRNDGGQAVLSICDSITPLPRTGTAVEQETTRLIAAATAKGVPAVRVRAQAATPGATVTAAPSRAPNTASPGSVLLIATGTLTAGAAGGALLLRRRRRGGSPARSAPV